MFRWLSSLAFVSFVMLPLTQTAIAMDWRSGRVITLGQGETLDDDLYAAAQTVAIDGTVNGDVIVFAQTVAINGTINGDFFTAAQYVVVLGTVTGSIRAASNTLYVGDKAKVGRDVIAVAQSLELKKGSQIGKDLAFAGADALLDGSISRNAKVAAEGLEVKGTVGGNLTVEVGENSDQPPHRVHFNFMNQARFDTAEVPAGIHIDKDAKIKGNLSYSQAKDLTFPPGTVLGKITRTEPAYERHPQRNAAHWVLDFVRTTVSLLLIGLVLLLLLPRLLSGLSSNLRAGVSHSFLWGLVALAACIASIILLSLVSIVLAVLFGAATLKALSATMVFAMLFGDATLILGFVFIAHFLAKLVVGFAIGEWLLKKGNSTLANHRFWPLLVGVPLLTIALALASMPLIPGIVAGALRFVILVLGLGAIWLKVREKLSSR